MEDEVRIAARGRPRAPAIDEAIHQAGWAVLGDFGYEGFTFEAVAERAACSRPALYRRYASKRDLVLALIQGRIQRIEPNLEQVSDPREALMAHVQGLARYLNDAGRGVSLGLAQARRHDPVLAAAADELYAGQRRFYVEAIQAAASKALPSGFSDLLADALVGAVIFRLALLNGDISDDELGLLVDQTLRSAEAG